MTSDEIICPVCGAATRPGRRCRKCAAELPEIDQPPSRPGQAERHGLRVTLVSEAIGGADDREMPMPGDPLIARLNEPKQYHVEVIDITGQAAPKYFPVPGKSGIALGRWTITQLDTRTILSAYFYISAAGHELDTWIHYDLDTGELITLSRDDEDSPDPAMHLRE